MHLIIRPNLNTERRHSLSGTLVVLRALEREDLKALQKWQNDEEIMRLARSFPDQVVSMEALDA